MNDIFGEIMTESLFSCDVPYLSRLFEQEYPWQIIPLIEDYAKALIFQGIDGFCEIRPGVLAGPDVKISENAVINGPAVIGAGCEIRPGAYIRGNVITGPDCVIGNSTELKNSVLLRHAQLPHYNYAGDSLLGTGAHMGAGAVCSNLKSDGGNVKLKYSGKVIETGLRKLGGMIGDGAEIGCGCVLNPGTVIGKRTSVYPLTPLRGIYPPDCIVKSQKETVRRLSGTCAG